jgi:hypothetical protein
MIMTDNKPAVKTDLGIQLSITVLMKCAETVGLPPRILNKGESCKRNELN